MFRRICLAFGLATLCFTASAKPLPLPLPLAQDLPVEVVLSQQELAIDVPATATAVGAQFGLIGALIGAGIQNAQVKSAEARVVPLRDQLIAYRFNERLEAALRAKLASDGLSPNPSITVLKTPWDAVDASQNAQTVPLHALVLIPRYAVDSDFNELAVALTAQLVDRKIKPNGKIKTSYQFIRTYTFHFPLEESETDNLVRWTSMGSSRLGELLDQGIAQTTDMLVHDFSAAGRAEWEQSGKRQQVMVKGRAYNGLAVRQAPDWAWVRAGKGRMQTLQGYQPLGGQAAPVPVEAATPAVAAPVAPAAAASAAAAPGEG
jgi:hypothetical protein